MIKTWTKSLLFFILVALVAAGDRAEAQSYPSSPVKVISDSAPGSAPDVILRIVADRLDPEDIWMPQFNCYDGLIIREGAEQVSNSAGLQATEAS